MGRLFCGQAMSTGSSISRQTGSAGDNEKGAPPPAVIGGLKEWAGTDCLHREEGLRTLLATLRIGGRRTPDSGAWLHRFVAWCVDSNIPEVLALAKTVDAWQPEIRALVRAGVTKTGAEGYNPLVGTGNCSACGFRNRENSVLRIRFHCTRTQRSSPQTFMLTARSRSKSRHGRKSVRFDQALDR